MPTGSYLVVRPNLWAHYLNVWFMPSGAEFENTIGLCKKLIYILLSLLFPIYFRFLCLSGLFKMYDIRARCIMLSLSGDSQNRQLLNMFYM